MPDRGYTVEPVFVETETGEQLADWSVDNGEARGAAIDNFNHAQSHFIHEDRYGQRLHEYEFVSPEEAQSIEDDYIRPIESEDVTLSPENEAAFADATFEAVGGEANYQAAVEFAANNWSSEEIDTYDAIMSSDNYEGRAKAVKYLMQQYERYING